MKYLTGKNPKRTKPFRKYREKSAECTAWIEERRKITTLFHWISLRKKGQKMSISGKILHSLHILIFFLNKSDGKIIKIISLVSHSLVGDATIQNTRCTMQCVLVFSHGQPKMKEKKEITWTLVYIIQLLHKKWLVFIREKIHSKRSWNCFKYNCIEKERKQKEKQPPPLAGVSLNSSATFAELDAQVRECWWFYLKDYFYALCAADEFFFLFAFDVCTWQLNWSINTGESGLHLTRCYSFFLSLFSPVSR